MRTRPFISIFVFFVAACLNLRRQSTGQENERQRDEEEDRQHAKGVGDCGGAILVEATKLVYPPRGRPQRSTARRAIGVLEGMTEPQAKPV